MLTALTHAAALHKADGLKSKVYMQGARAGEEAAFKILVEAVDDTMRIVWVNQEEETRLPYDIKV